MLYAAYGMNLDPSTMDYFNAEPRGAGVLHGWQLDCRCYMDVQPVEGASVQVGLWEIDDAALRSLDGREGYPHHYARREVDVRTAEGTKRAIVYLMRKPGPTCSPGAGYLGLVRAGYAFFGLDDACLEAALRRVSYRCEQCGKRADVYAIDPEPDGWGGYYCEDDARALGFDVIDRL